MKSPPVQFHDDEARERVEAFIADQEVGYKFEDSSKTDAPQKQTQEQKK
jgi:hypothetical protein